MPNPRLMLMPLLMLTTDTTAVDTVTDMVSDTAVTTVDTTDTPMLDTDTVTLARGPLMPSPRLMPLLMLTTDTTAVDTDTVMAVTMVDTTDTPDTVMAVSDTTVRLSKSQLAIVTTPLELFQLNTSAPSPSQHTSSFQKTFRPRNILF